VRSTQCAMACGGEVATSALSQAPAGARARAASATAAAAVCGAIGQRLRASATPMPAHSPCATMSMRQRASAALRSRSALPTTDAELRLIASAAIIGDSSQPVNGYSSPAARGTPSAL